MELDIRIIRTLWALVETANPYSLSKLSDPDLVKKLLEEIERVFSLSSEDIQILSQYIGTRTLLIKDLAYAKID